MPLYLFCANNKFGALNIAPFLLVPDIPTIITEWAVVIPLVCHSASYKRDYELVGQLSLSGCLSIGIFPKLLVFPDSSVVDDIFIHISNYRLALYRAYRIRLTYFQYLVRLLLYTSISLI